MTSAIYENQQHHGAMSTVINVINCNILVKRPVEILRHFCMNFGAHVCKVGYGLFFVVIL